MDIEALSGLTNLKELTLCIDDRVLDLSPLTPLKNLRALTLFCQGSDWAKPSLTDLTPIGQLTELQSLALYERNKMCIRDRVWWEDGRTLIFA